MNFDKRWNYLTINRLMMLLNHFYRSIILNKIQVNKKLFKIHEVD